MSDPKRSWKDCSPPLEISCWLSCILLSSHFKLKALYIFLYDCIAEHNLGMI